MTHVSIEVSSFFVNKFPFTPSLFISQQSYFTVTSSSIIIYPATHKLKQWIQDLHSHWILNEL